MSPLEFNDKMLFVLVLIVLFKFKNVVKVYIPMIVFYCTRSFIYAYVHDYFKGF